MQQPQATWIWSTKKREGAWIQAIQVIQMTRQPVSGLRARIADHSAIIIPMERRLDPIPDSLPTAAIEDSRVVKEAVNTINNGLQCLQPRLLNLRPNQNFRRRWWRRMSSKLVLSSMPAARNRTWIIYSIFNLNQEDQNLRIINIKDHLRDQEFGNSPTPKGVPNTTRNNIFKQSKLKSWEKLVKVCCHFILTRFFKTEFLKFILVANLWSSHPETTQST